MGQGGYITLVNGTKYDWNKSYQHSYQMNSWDLAFPGTIQAGASISVKVEWKEAAFVNSGDDGGEITYTLKGTNLSFQVQARADNGFHLQIAFTNLATLGNPQGRTINLGWIHDGNVNFILSGEDGNFTSNYLPTSWMQDNLNVLGNRTLGQICIPGSHDAGMCKCTYNTLGTFECNARTQTHSILQQLLCGSRFFDIRPVQSHGDFYTGHYGYIDQIKSWQGACGQSIQSVIDDINAFTASNKELVILCLSHAYDTDIARSRYQPFIPAQWKRLFAMLADPKEGLKNLFIVPQGTDLTTIALNDYIGGNRAAVIVIVRPDSIELGDFANKGFYIKEFPLVMNDERTTCLDNGYYSNTDDPKTMKDDQLCRMEKYAPTNYFLLSWTLTQQDTKAVGGGDSILGLANKANPQLRDNLLPACSKGCYPNILFVDNISHVNIVETAMEINKKII